MKNRVQIGCFDCQGEVEEGVRKGVFHARFACSDHAVAANVDYFVCGVHWKLEHAGCHTYPLRHGGGTSSKPRNANRRKRRVHMMDDLGLSRCRNCGADTIDGFLRLCDSCKKQQAYEEEGHDAFGQEDPME